MLHVHVFLVGRLYADYATQEGTDKQESGILIREAANHPRPPSDLAVEPLQNIVCSDACPGLEREVVVSQCFLYAVLYLS